MGLKFDPQKLVARYFPRSVVREIYPAIFGQEPDAQDLNRLIAALQSPDTFREAIRDMQAFATVGELYRGIFNRSPEAAGREYWSKLLSGGKPLREIISRMLASDEFKRSMTGRTIRQSDLPDITGSLPRPYETGVGLDNLVHNVIPIEQDSEFDLLEHLIVEHRFYDSFGGWGYSIDLDKHVTAAIVKGLGARSCLDIGCSNGPVISLLERDGLDVVGLDCSHLAFALAFPNVRTHMRFGDILSVDFGRTFDAVVAMDIFEHLNPLKLGKYIERAAELVDTDGYLFLNSPMFGSDPVFGSPFPLHLEAWTHESQSSFWRHIPCDAKGWPWDGHLIWAAVSFWEQQFASCGLVRDREIEVVIQRLLKNFFAEFAPARRAIFILKRPENGRRSAEVAAQVAEALATVDGLPRAS